MTGYAEGALRIVRNKRFDPRTKLALGAMGIAVILTTQNTLSLIIELSLLCGALLGFKMVAPWIRALKLILPLVGFVFVVAIISFTASTALMLSLRLLNLLTVSFVFFQSISPEELGNSFRKMGIPYEFCFILTTSLRYVPLIGGKIRSIMDAQLSRGIDLRPRLRNIPHFVALLMPLLAQSLVLSEQLAMAMESRGFARRGRSFRREYRISIGEYAIMGVALALLVGFMVWERGWMRY
ncbi:MAG: energy-coupling factor transporter transmembrane protein EcfT [Deltaproteobacteria bacterium]|nr:energy-coupling factor transporter transmembrane protein EcfT [Deltaproteobacteria bacterium]